MLALRETPAAYSGGPRLLDRVRHAIRARHYSRRTEKAYVGWIKRYIFFHGKRHPSEMGAAEVSRFLTALAVDRDVAASTQNQAMNALVFLYRVVLEHDLPWLDDVVRARRPRHLPVVFTRDEVRRVLARLDGPRVTMLPATAKPGLFEQIIYVRRQYANDVERNAGWAWLPDALARKYPRAAREIGWQWVFRLPVPTSTRSPDSTDDIISTKPSYSARCAARCVRRIS